MKTKIFALFLGMMCLITSALAQSETLTGFNGTITLSSFSNNGPYVRGTLRDFRDQTGLYICSNIDSADVVWDNNGKRYAVVSVISSNATQAVVDLNRIGGGTHIPKGAGFVCRETANGLSLVPAQNSNGISAQLMARVLTHNMLSLEKLSLDFGNVLFVSPNGDDDTAIQGSMQSPYQTLSAAVSAASSGTLIYVLPGSYSAGNLWKNGLTYYFDNAKVGASAVASEGGSNSAIFSTTGDGEKVIVRGTLEAYQLIDVRHKNNVFDAEGYLLGQVFIGPGANKANVTVRSHLTPGALYQYTNASDTVTRNNVSFIADVWIGYNGITSGHYPIAFFNNTATRGKLNNYNIEIGSVNMTSWEDFYSNRGIIQCRSVGMGFDSTTLRLNIGKGVFDLVGSNVASFSLLAFWPFQASVGNQLFFNCDDCILKNRATLANGTVQPNTTDLIKVSGNYKSYNKTDQFFVSGGSATTNKFIFDGYYYANDTSMFALGDRANWEFGGLYKTRENDDLIITANWASTGSRPLLRNSLFDTPTTTPIQSNVATTWFKANARETKTITKDPDITFTEENEY